MQAFRCWLCRIPVRAPWHAWSTTFPLLRCTVSQHLARFACKAYKVGSCAGAFATSFTESLPGHSTATMFHAHNAHLLIQHFPECISTCNQLLPAATSWHIVQTQRPLSWQAEWEPVEAVRCTAKSLAKRTQQRIATGRVYFVESPYVHRRCDSSEPSLLALLAEAHDDVVQVVGIQGKQALHNDVHRCSLADARQQRPRQLHGSAIAAPRVVLCS